MDVEIFCLGNLATNAFAVYDAADCYVFDCPANPGELIAAVRARGAVVRAVYLTHAHVDHIAGLDDLRAAFPGLRVWVHGLEASWLSDPAANLSMGMGDPVTVAPADGVVSDGELLTVGPWTVEVLHLPGHSPGSVAYHVASEAEVFGGDVLFRSGVGRWDFPGSDGRALRASLERLCRLPDHTRVRPGHGASTTIGREKTSNVYLRSDEPWR